MNYLVERRKGKRKGEINVDEGGTNVGKWRDRKIQVADGV